MKTITTKINKLPKAPNLENPIDFDKHADIFVRSLNPFGDELNELAQQINEVSFFVEQKSDELVNFIKLRLEEIKLKSNEEKLNLLEYSKELENVILKHTQDKTKEVLNIIDEKGYEIIERLNDNCLGADYLALSQSLAHNISIERFLWESNIIKLSQKDISNNEQLIIETLINKDNIKSTAKILQQLLSLINTQNEINQILKKENNDESKSY
ncbi:hypothetical protein [Campylobacter insulaenigrae]|uniref:Uncharacterized protein n=1 Tax=Campylobacter insulaenigrae NCTC 12927 TaxID=1031564 RepID=A0A0A8H4E6_9BACT|nr:hypothetical protein [Campylobacter insulaenigrae]AJC87794.1 hypothetical protein CINS_0830 [Campylobacter insulaenigrae NCTC 12927]MCR6572978.1 hypothetical protein [Campylobacter insulaenigrae]MCR6577444.1 hypothetical protein [Campylobacter insulaenigrae]MCR6581593.1 hypothetical protein [Campylobacter insulaenigrae]MCR6586532.1 hypothetical protein [Campylobacter insulaenigrae]